MDAVCDVVGGGVTTGGFVAGGFVVGGFVTGGFVVGGDVVTVTVAGEPLHVTVVPPPVQLMPNCVVVARAGVVQSDPYEDGVRDLPFHPVVPPPVPVHEAGYPWAYHVSAAVPFDEIVDGDALN
jgi:hypothetical protein